MLANILGQSGVRTLLIERRCATVGEPRAVSIDDESLRTIQSVMLHEEALKDIVPGYGVHYYTHPGGRCFARVEPSAKPYGFHKRNAFRQPLLERTLLAGLHRYPCVQVRFDCELVDFYQDEQGVCATTRNAAGMLDKLQAAYLVGTDGGRSLVRKTIGATLCGTSFTSRWVIVDTEEDDDSFWQTRVYCDARRPVVDVPGPHRTRRFEFLLKPHESEGEALSPAVLNGMLRPFRGDRPTHIVRKTVYTFHARVADRWRDCRVFIAGDAAHLTPPYAGQGMNSGIRDAHNLGWKLVAVLGRGFSNSLLDTYQTERRDHAWALIKLALTLGIVMAPKSKASAALSSGLLTLAAYIPPLRTYLMQMRFKPKPRFETGIVVRQDSNPLAGTMFPQPELQLPGQGNRLLDDLIGPYFCLIQLGGAQALTNLRLPIWKRLDVRRIHIVPKYCETSPALPDGPILAQDINSALAALFASLPGKIVLLRPDRYVAAVFDLEEEAEIAWQLNVLLGPSSSS